MQTETEPKVDLLACNKNFHVSLIASAVRTPLYQMFLNSLEGTSVRVEVIFVGHVTPDVVLHIPENVSFRYIKTGFIKPSQCYEIARRAASGEVIVWVADDCEFINDVLGKAYRFWKDLKDEKAILSIQTKEYYLTSNKSVDFNFCDMTLHSFYGGYPETPRMAPLGMISREYFEKLGGIDRRYVSGQYENDVVMRAYRDGGCVVMFGDRQTYIDIDHIGKQRIVQPGATINDFYKRPFALSYPHDRRILETSWCGGEKQPILPQRTDVFEPFEDEENLLLHSEGPRGIWK